MIAVKSWEVTGYTAARPFERTLKCLLSPKLHPVNNIAIGMVILPPGARSNPHVHEHEEETWFVVSGRGEVMVGGEKVAVEPEMLIVAPPGKMHQVLNPGREPLKMLWIFTPPGPEEEHIR